MKPNYQNRNLLKKTYFKYSGLHKDLAEITSKKTILYKTCHFQTVDNFEEVLYMFKTDSYWQPQRRGIRSFYILWFVCAQIDTRVLIWVEGDPHMFKGEGTNV